MNKILAVLVYIGGVVAAIYFGLWCMIVQPIMHACAAFDAGGLTATIVAITVLKIIFASTISGIIMWVASVISAFLAYK